LICNADESEPGTFKDRYIIYQDPHQLLEGMIIACYAVNARLAYIYIRGEFPEGAQILEKALADARQRGFVGKNILRSGFDCEIYVHRGAGAYICGEETGLIESLEGKRAYPRIKPPYFPAVLGLYQSPTIVNNVETLCDVKHIIRMGGAEYAKLGKPNNTGTRILCVSGDVQKPGYYELEVGTVTLGELIHKICGGLKARAHVESSYPRRLFGESFESRRKVQSKRSGARPGGYSDGFRFARRVRVNGRLWRRHRHGRYARHGRGAEQHQRLLRPRIVRTMHPMP
jgi:NADH-quinone oxidoreductase subunit F